MQRLLVVLGVLAVLAVLAAISACSSWEYQKPGATRAQVAEDSRVCQQTSTEASLVSIPTLMGDESVTVPSERLDRDAFNRCMSERGYAVRGW
jgi:hypothetical protein